MTQGSPNRLVCLCLFPSDGNESVQHHAWRIRWVQGWSLGLSMGGSLPNEPSFQSLTFMDIWLLNSPYKFKFIAGVKIKAMGKLCYKSRLRHRNSRMGTNQVRNRKEMSTANTGNSTQTLRTVGSAPRHCGHWDQHPDTADTGVSTQTPRTLESAPRHRGQWGQHPDTVDTEVSTQTLQTLESAPRYRGHWG